MAGMPRHLGPLTKVGTQVRFLLLDGSTTDLTFCVACAEAIGPADYTAIGEAQIEYEDLCLAQARPTFRDDQSWQNHRTQHLIMWQGKPIMAKVAAVLNDETLGRVMVDRRVSRGWLQPPRPDKRQRRRRRPAAGARRGLGSALPRPAPPHAQRGGRRRKREGPPPGHPRLPAE